MFPQAPYIGGRYISSVAMPLHPSELNEPYKN